MCSVVAGLATGLAIEISSLDFPAMKPNVKPQSSTRRHLLIEMRQHLRPCIFVALSGLFVKETRMRQPQQRPDLTGQKFDCDHGLGPVSCGSNPRHLYKPIFLKPEEPAIVRMSLSF